MVELRDIKLDLLMGNQNLIVDLFRKITDGLRIINTSVYNEDGFEFIYYNQCNEWIFYQDAKKGVFWCSRERYWTLFSDELSLKYNEIQAITKYLVEETLKREISVPYLDTLTSQLQVEETLKREISAPYEVDSLINKKVEEAIKRELAAPKFIVRLYAKESHSSLNNMVEEAIKRELATPHWPVITSSIDVEEALKREMATYPMVYYGANQEIEKTLKRETDYKDKANND